MIVPHKILFNMTSRFSIMFGTFLLAHEFHNKKAGDISTSVINPENSSNFVISLFPSNASIPAEKLIPKNTTNANNCTKENITILFLLSFKFEMSALGR